MGFSGSVNGTTQVFVFCFFVCVEWFKVNTLLISSQVRDISSVSKRHTTVETHYNKDLGTMKITCTLLYQYEIRAFSRMRFSCHKTEKLWVFLAV